MKKILFLLLYFFATSTLILVTAQSLSPEQIEAATYSDQAEPINFEAQKIAIDSATAQSALNGAWNLALLITGGGQFIPGVPNTILYAVLSFIVGFVYRRKELKKLRQKGVLFDNVTSTEPRPGFFKRVFKVFQRKSGG